MITNEGNIDEHNGIEIQEEEGLISGIEAIPENAEELYEDVTELSEEEEEETSGGAYTQNKKRYYTYNFTISRSFCGRVFFGPNKNEGTITRTRILLNTLDLNISQNASRIVVSPKSSSKIGKGRVQFHAYTSKGFDYLVTLNIELWK